MVNFATAGGYAIQLRADLRVSRTKVCPCALFRTFTSFFRTHSLSVEGQEDQIVKNLSKFFKQQFNVAYQDGTMDGAPPFLIQWHDSKGGADWKHSLFELIKFLKKEFL